MARRKNRRGCPPKLTGAPIENAPPPTVALPLAGSSARASSSLTELTPVVLQPPKASAHTKPDEPKAGKTSSANRGARLNSSPTSTRLQVKATRKGRQESWTVATTTKPPTKGSRQTAFRVRVSDVGYRVCLVYYDDENKRREPYLCYLNANEWKQAKRGSLSDFAKLVINKLTERAAKEGADGEKLSDLARRVKAHREQQE